LNKKINDTLNNAKNMEALYTMEELLQMSLLKDCNPKEKKKAGEEYVPG